MCLIRKKERAILYSLTYKIKKSGRNETKFGESIQNETENRNHAMSLKASLENYCERLNYSSKENPIIGKCLIPLKSIKSIFKQFNTKIPSIEGLKPIKEKNGLVVIAKIRTEGQRQVFNDKNDNNGRTPPFIIRL